MASKETEKNEPAQTETTEVVAQATETAEQNSGDAEASEGVRARRAFMLKQFIPNPDWINVNIVAKGKGTQVTVGRVYGTCLGYEDKVNTLPDGSPSQSVALKGIFQAESYLTGELSEFTVAYLPAAYSEKVKAVFVSDQSIKLVELDCDIGLEATGKTIPYEWVVTAYIEGQEMARLKALRNRRARPATAPALAAPAAAPQLTNQSA